MCEVSDCEPGDILAYEKDEWASTDIFS
ncbi:MAG: hypothetical protein MI750_02535 [Xanthomonadales bacterium]|nr:hypothetical protein [Xanthomonadales bacterium]